jgi:hypothetical protein
MYICNFTLKISLFNVHLYVHYPILGIRKNIAGTAGISTVLRILYIGNI